MRSSKEEHTDEELLLMADLSTALKRYRKGREWKVEEAAKQLGVCRASFYKYEAQTDLPRKISVLRRLREWGVLDFADDDRLQALARHRKNRPKSPEGQLLLPFIEAIRPTDIQITRVQAKKPHSVEFVLKLNLAASGRR